MRTGNKGCGWMKIVRFIKILKIEKNEGFYIDNFLRLYKKFILYNEFFRDCLRNQVLITQMLLFLIKKNKIVWDFVFKLY